MCYNIHAEKKKLRAGGVNWSERRESNPCHQLGKLKFYH